VRGKSVVGGHQDERCKLEAVALEIADGALTIVGTCLKLASRLPSLRK